MSAPQVMASAAWTATCATTASWTNYGAGFAGSLGVPVLTLGAPPVLGATTIATVGNSAGAPTLAALVVGSAPANIPTTIGGVLLVIPDSYELVTLPAGGIAVPITFPNLPSLCGAHLYGQVIEADPAAQFGWAFSAGIELVLGN
jgi:hypothetical protein